MKRLNKNGAALILAYFFMSALVTLAVGFALATFNELNDARRYRDSIAAFWIDEAALNTFKNSPGMLDQAGEQKLFFPNGSVYLSKDDSQPMKRIVTAVGVVGGVKRTLQLEFPANAPEVFNNTISVNGNIEIVGRKISIAFNDKTRISGKVTNASKHSSAYFEDLEEGLDKDLVSMSYTDANNNGTRDEFDDFIQFNRNLIANYPKEEVIYIKGNDTYTIIPNSALNGKKIIYVEGSREGKGDVIVQYSGSWTEKQNLTVIATGTVTFNQVGADNTDSQFNIIAWSGYFETAALAGSHKGMTYTHGTAEFDEVNEKSITYGSIVANEGLKIKEVWSNKTFTYADTRINGVVPPGFEGLTGGRTSSDYGTKPSAWKEI